MSAHNDKSAPPSRGLGHTAGPWRWSELGDGFDAYTIDAPDSGQVGAIALIPEIPERHASETSANARLIASAPALYAALQACMVRLDSDANADLDKFAVEQARAALRAAGGGA